MAEVVLPYLQERMCNKAAAMVKATHVFHHPHDSRAGLRPHIALVLMGEEGCGKTRLTEFIASLVGDSMYFNDLARQGRVQQIRADAVQEAVAHLGRDQAARDTCIL
jgi:hypothetical protein